MGKKIDNSIVLLRFIAIALIVYHHSISSLCGWPPVDVVLPDLPKPVLFSSDLARSIGLVLFTFISGYLTTHNNKSYSYNYMWKKVKKIILPCVLVASIYYFLFPSMMSSRNPISGTHLWYLPMIFLFYLFSPVINTNNFIKSAILMLSLFAAFVIASELMTIRTIIECKKYWPVFVGGGYFSRLFTNSDKQRKAIIVAFALILMVDPGIHNIIFILLVCCVLYLLVYLGYHYLEKTRIYKWAILVSNTSFEIYLFHQFVINALLLAALHMRFNLYLIPLISLVINLLALPYLIIIEHKIVYCLKHVPKYKY